MSNPPARVLVVDDDELARMEIARCVEQQGHERHRQTVDAKQERGSGWIAHWEVPR